MKDRQRIRLDGENFEKSDITESIRSAFDGQDVLFYVNREKLDRLGITLTQEDIFQTYKKDTPKERVSLFWRRIGIDPGVQSLGLAYAIYIRSEVEYFKAHWTEGAPFPVPVAIIFAEALVFDNAESTKYLQGQTAEASVARRNYRSTRKLRDRKHGRMSLIEHTLIKVFGVNVDEEIRHAKGAAQYQWDLRAKAVTEEVSLEELSIIIYALCRKRGYSSSPLPDSETVIGKDKEENPESEAAPVSAKGKKPKKEKNEEQKVKEGVVAMHNALKESGLTPGQYFVKKREKEGGILRKKNVYIHRDDYMAEYDAIMKTQQKYHPEVLDDMTIGMLGRIIFFQRPLKFVKGKIGACAFMNREIIANGSMRIVGSPCAPVSSPLSELSRILQAANAITVKGPEGERRLTIGERNKVVDYLLNHASLKSDDIMELLGLDPSLGYKWDDNVSKGIKGSNVIRKICKALGKKDLSMDDLDLKYSSYETTIEKVDKDKERISVQATQEEIAPESLEKASFDEKGDLKVDFATIYRIWHTIFMPSGAKPAQVVETLGKNFGIDGETARKLVSIDLPEGRGKLSASFLRKLIPQLLKGLVYSDATAQVGFRHSDFATGKENGEKQYREYIVPPAKGSLRQPTVERSVMIMVNEVNRFISVFGVPDAANVELPRALRQDKDVRKKVFMENAKREKLKEAARKELEELAGKDPRIKVTDRNVSKVMIYHETDGVCLYTGEKYSLEDLLVNGAYDIDHIVPRSMDGPNSDDNKAACPVSVNRISKNALAALDYVESLGEAEKDAYVERVSNLHKERKISDEKYGFLMMTKDKWTERAFSEGSLTQTGFISRTIKNLLGTVIPEVEISVGKITGNMRAIWNYDRILIEANLPEAEKAGKVYCNTKGEKVIEGYGKRNDHRHHALDALVIACYFPQIVRKYGMICNNFNNLSPEEKCNRPGVNRQFNEFIHSLDHIPYEDLVMPFRSLAVERKVNNRIMRKSKEGRPEPRRSLCADTIYGYDEATGNNTIRRSVSKLNHLNVKDIIDDDIREAFAKKLSEKGAKYTAPSAIIDMDRKEIISEKETEGRKNIRVVDKVKMYARDNICKIGSDYKALDGNEHLAVYKATKGKKVSYEQVIVPYFFAVERYRADLPIVVEDAAAWREEARKAGLGEENMKASPEAGWELSMVFRIGMNLIIGTSEEERAEIAKAVEEGDNAVLEGHMYTVQALTYGEVRMRRNSDARKGNDPLIRMSPVTVVKANAKVVKLAFGKIKIL